MVKAQHINIIKTAIDIQKTCTPPGKTLLLGEGRQAEQPALLPEKKVSTPNFKAGNHYPGWEKITSDRIILDINKNGLKIDFMERLNIMCSPKFPKNEYENRITNAEIEKLSQKGFIIKCERQNNDFVSTIFTRKKKDGSFRTILNLKCPNKFVKNKHFKIKPLKNVFKIIKRRVGWPMLTLKVHSLQCLFTNLIKNILTLNGVSHIC